MSPISLLAVADDDYEAVIDLELVISRGETRVCYTLSILQDLVCEDTPNEQFLSDLAYVSGLQPTINLSTAIVLIDDTEEPECSKCGCQCVVHSHIMPNKLICNLDVSGYYVTCVCLFSACLEMLGVLLIRHS